MKLNHELSGAIRTIEMMLDKLSAKEEFCVSDIEASLVEWRGALYGATNGEDIIFKDDFYYTVTLFNVNHSFKWPKDAYGHIESFILENDKIYATDVCSVDLQHNPDNTISLPTTHSCTKVLVGSLPGVWNGSMFITSASKTNLKMVC